MKKYFFITALSFAGMVPATQAQNPIDKAAAQVPVTPPRPAFNVKTIANNIMSKLGPTLALTAVQKPKVLSSVTDFLTKKSGILSLATSDKAQYAAKLAGLNTGLLDKLKGVLTASQYTQFLGLKPKTADATNPLSQLFF